MSRSAATFLAIAFSLISFSSANAGHHHKLWFKFFEGTWSYEIPSDSESGTVTWKRVASGNALAGEFLRANGTIENELTGWDPIQRAVVATGFGASDGSFWKITLDKITDDTMSGEHIGSLEDGRTYKGVFTLKKKDADHFSWVSEGKANDGEAMKRAGAFARTSSEDAQSNYKKWLEYLDGKWSYKITGDLQEEGLATFKKLGEGFTMNAKFESSNGVGFESGGWDSTRELMLVTGYGSSDGEYWRLELKSNGEGKWNGTHYTVLPDGSDVTARFTISTIDKSNAEWTSEGMTSNGASVKMNGKFTRITE
ncbi:hypothetical protein NZK35_05125 [Stieleria sp. ICT_E10.1]|uniref:hypothetical protein n=1 Tax=Stieleria sedimenti TaxID=2976331 RepID=UPI00217F98FA|nr:hypothetical protein [Stieleria sedimenti]MCS7466056.1 hypothetical protein [Stieleria sedimenti]